MWHHRNVFLFPALPMNLAAAVLLLLSAVSGMAQAHAPVSHKPVAARPRPSAKPQDPVAELTVYIKAQAAAVDGGDPATIITASTRLNAQIDALLAQFRLAEGKPQEAIALYRRSLQLQPSTERRLEFASALLRSGNAAAAIPETEAIIADEPNNAIAWMTRGSALRDAGRGKEAVEVLTHALELQSDPNTAFALGATYLSLHDKPKAAALFGRLLEASEQSPIWYIAIGDAYRDQGYMEEAVQSLKQGLKRDPKAPHGEFFLGLTYLQMNQWGPNSDSFQHLRQAVLQNPHEYLSNFYLGALESTDGSDLPASDKHLHAAAEADPSQPEVWIYLGINANRVKRTADAKIYLQKAIDLTGGDEARNAFQVRRAYFSLGRILIAEGDRPHGEALLARYKAAEQAAVELSGKSIDATERGEGANPSLSSLSKPAPPRADDGRLTESAAVVADRRLRRDAEDKLQKLLSTSANDRGTAEAREHQYEAALSDFQMAEQADPANVLALRNLGIAAFRLKNNAEAIRALALYREKQTTSGRQMDGHAQLMLALAYFGQGDFADARTSFAPVEAAALEDPSTAYSYAFALSHTGHGQEANRIADNLAGRTLPDDLLPLVCHLYIDTENFTGSQTCYRKALEQNPSLQLAHYEIGESLIHLDRPAEAIPDLREELKLTPDDPNVRTALAFALLQVSEKVEARTLLEGTVQSHPEHAEAQYEFGKLLIESGDLAEGILHLEQSSRSDPSKDYVHYQLGTAYKKAGRAADAERELHVYREIKDKNRNNNAIPR